MTTSRRQKIRDAAEIKLINGGFSTVDQSSEEEISVMPAVRVSLDTESSQIICRTPLSDQRVADLNIEVYAQADNIDESCVSVEEILLTDPTLDGLVLSSDYTGYTLSLTDKNTNARAVCAFELMYTTEFTNAQ